MCVVFFDRNGMELDWIGRQWVPTQIFKPPITRTKEQQEESDHKKQKEKGKTQRLTEDTGFPFNQECVTSEFGRDSSSSGSLEEKDQKD